MRKSFPGSDLWTVQQLFIKKYEDFRGVYRMPRLPVPKEATTVLRL